MALDVHNINPRPEKFHDCGYLKSIKVVDEEKAIPSQSPRKRTYRRLPSCVHFTVVSPIDNIFRTFHIRKFQTLFNVFWPSPN